MRFALAALLTFAAPAPLRAQEMQMPTIAPGAPIAASAMAGTYKVDSDHTQALFSASHLGFTATATIKRSEFGLTSGVPLVSDRVDLTINAAFEAQ